MDDERWTNPPVIIGSSADLKPIGANPFKKYHHRSYQWSTHRSTNLPFQTDPPIDQPNQSTHQTQLDDQQHPPHTRRHPRAKHRTHNPTTTQTPDPQPNHNPNTGPNREGRESRGCVWVRREERAETEKTENRRKREKKSGWREKHGGNKIYIYIF